MLDVITQKKNAKAIIELCRKTANAKVIGAWKDDGELSGAEYDSLDVEGKRTEASKLTKADVPFDQAAYQARIGHAQDVHRFAGQADRQKVKVGDTVGKLLEVEKLLERSQKLTEG